MDTCIDKLQSDDHQQYHSALVGIKNAVIGSNRQKESVISQGIVPKLLSLITNGETPLDIKLDALIVVGKISLLHSSFHSLLPPDNVLSFHFP